MSEKKEDGVEEFDGLVIIEEETKDMLLGRKKTPEELRQEAEDRRDQETGND